MQLTTVGALVFSHTALRDRVRDRDFLRFGTAIIVSYRVGEGGWYDRSGGPLGGLLRGQAQTLERGPTRVNHGMHTRAVHVVAVRPAHWAQPTAGGVA